VSLNLSLCLPYMGVHVTIKHYSLIYRRVVQACPPAHELTFHQLCKRDINEECTSIAVVLHIDRQTPRQTLDRHPITRCSEMQQERADMLVTRRKYKRYSKQKMTYLGLIASVIQNAPEKRLTFYEVSCNLHILRQAINYRPRPIDLTI